MHRRTLAATCLTAAGLALTACSSNDSGSTAAGSKPDMAASTTEAGTPKDATADYALIHGAIPTTALTATVTAANDGNHLLGRPHQYTSAIKFSDSRIKAADVDGLDKDDVTRGGGIEVFGNHDDAQARAAYIQAVTKGMPALTEYDYVSGNVVVRVSHLLTPDQAGKYKAAAAKLG
ncbi:hypothetical protein [Streptomyces sp. NPDC026673]|uniref:hypothetical protein n=1 Tax=Streptomyces sp. NPDC026673 TaxID=3155724 RepID=UPI0033DD600B